MLLCVASMATLSSCSKDNEDLLIGKCEVEKCSQTINGNVTDLSAYIGKIWEFKTGGMLTVNGDDVNYSINGNNITIIGGIWSGTITTLTKSELVLDLHNLSIDSRHCEFKRK